ncbi:putative vacuolar (H+)-ATPase G subunit, RRF superfamily [Helianthus anomalus]
MEDYRRQGGIHQLLATEQEARQIVNAARTAKSNRLKQAKDEAEDEVGKYRTHMEKEYQKKVSEIDHFKKQVAKVSLEVVKLLMTQVTNV